MKAWTLLKDKIVLKRKEDEAFYAIALNEFSSGKIRPGLMAKAMAKCKGNESEARAEYIKLLTQAIRDDHYLHNRSIEEELRAAELAQAKDSPSWIENKEPKKEPPPKPKRWAWDDVVSYTVVALIIVVIAADRSGFPIDPRYYISKYLPTSTTATQPPPQNSNFQTLLKRYEEIYPQINPNSPHYNAATTERIAARITALKNAGYTPEQALEISIKEAF